MRGLSNEIAINRRKHFEEALATKQVTSWIDKHINKQGNVEYKLRNFYPLFEKDQLQFVIGYGIDITKRKQIELQLNQALVQMQKSNDELEQFAYVASHDLQEPLRMIASFLNLLSLKFNNDLNDDAKKYVQFAVNGATRMQQIITDLLEFSKVGKTEDKLEVVDLNVLVTEIIALQSRHIEEKTATINIAPLPIINTFKAPIRQVFQNLINNSLKYCKDDVPPTINIICTDNKTHWLFTLTDNGIGIEEQYFEKIFVIFQRLHSRDKFSGTGIGLAITKKIIENVGGTIWLTSQKNIGTTFYFTITK
jgi:light-regulated signal transduction histidine kinase (bacteriophytochrome)